MTPEQDAGTPATVGSDSAVGGSFQRIGALAGRGRTILLRKQG